MKCNHTGLSPTHCYCRICTAWRQVPYVAHQVINKCPTKPDQATLMIQSADRYDGWENLREL